MRELENLVMLKVVDTHWMEHLDAMDVLREGIGLRAYGQRDPWWNTSSKPTICSKR